MISDHVVVVVDGATIRIERAGYPTVEFDPQKYRTMEADLQEAREIIRVLLESRPIYDVENAHERADAFLAKHKEK